MTMFDYVTIEHAVLGRAEVIRTSLEVWLAREWKVVEDDAKAVETAVTGEAKAIVADVQGQTPPAPTLPVVPTLVVPDLNAAPKQS